MSDTIVCAWWMRAETTSIQIWPDGCRDLVVTLAPGGSPRAICTALDWSAQTVNCPVGTMFFGLRFAPGVALPWDRDGERALSANWGLGALGRSLLELAPILELSPARVPGLLQDQVRPWLEPAPSWVEDFLGAIQVGAPVGHVIQRRNSRSLRRQMVRVTGAPRRFWQGLARARQAAKAIALGNAPLAEIALAVDFVDQPHMTREVRRWFGLSPGAMRSAREQAAPRLLAPDAFTGVSPDSQKTF